MDFKKRFAVQDEQGVWVKFEDVEIKLLRPGTRLAEQAVNRVIPLKQDQTDQTVDDLMRMTAKMAAALVVDWKGIEDDGVEVPYSPEAAYEYLYQYEDFRKFISAEGANLKVTSPEAADEDKEVKKK